MIQESKVDISNCENHESIARSSNADSDAIKKQGLFANWKLTTLASLMRLLKSFKDVIIVTKTNNL